MKAGGNTYAEVRRGGAATKGILTQRRGDAEKKCPRRRGVSHGAFMLSGVFPLAVILRNEEPPRRRRTGQAAGRCNSGEPISSGIFSHAGEERQRSQVLRFAQNDGQGGAPGKCNSVPESPRRRRLSRLALQRRTYLGRRGSAANQSGDKSHALHNAGAIGRTQSGRCDGFLPPRLRGFAFYP